VRSPQTLNQLGRKGVVRGIDAQTEIGHCHVPGCPKYDSTLVLRGDVKKTKKRLKALVEGGAAEAQTTIKAKLKRLKQLKEEPTRPKIKVKFTATDEFGQKATLERKVTLCSRLIRVDREKKICRWHPSQKRCALTARLT
jgi:peptidyl-tRNA hydrolase